MKGRNKKTITKGVICIASTGTGYVTSAGFDADILIEPHFLNTALNGDEVEFAVFPQTSKEKITGEITRILRRAKAEFVGTMDKGKEGAFRN